MVAAVSGNPAFIARESGAAIVCEPGDVSALATAVLRAATLSDNELDAMGRSGEQYFRAHFSEDVAGAAMASLLVDVVNSSRDRG
jgi:glycosyltransferase involved in cell wall biosynthesis